MSLKCKVLHFGAKNPHTTYYMNGVALESDSQEKDLGVMIHDSLKPTTQCSAAAKKASTILGQIRRSFSFTDRDIVLKLYLTFVRPHLEYAVQAWTPWYESDIQLLEKVQMRAVNMIPGLRGSYSDKLKTLGLLSLRDRRTRGDAIETYKILNGFQNTDPTTWFDTATRPDGAITRQVSSTHGLRLRPSRLDLRKYFFSVRAAKTWNGLPDDVRSATTVNGFKSAYDRHWRSLPSQ